jgi:hypothetical protein
MQKTARVTVLLSVACWLWTAHLPAHAQQPSTATAHPPAPPSHDARTDRLRGLSKPDLARLEPQLQAGPVALIEFADDDADELPAINVAAIVHAKARDVIALVEKPEGYSHFMRTLDEVKVVRRDASGVIYDWRWQMSLLSLEGRNAMTIYTPPPDRPETGYRATIDSQSGDFGTGRISIRVWPHGEQQSLLCISLRLDLRSANFVARKLAEAAHSINRSANMSLTYAMLLSFRREAEHRAGYSDPARTAGELRQPPVDIGAIMPLLQRGDVVLLNMTGDRLDQIAVFGVIYYERALVRKVMLDADAFGAALLPGSSAKVVSRQGLLTTFDWDINLPLIGASGRMQVRDADPLIAVDAIDGALRGGRWNFETRALAKNATLLASWASFDVRNSTWLVRGLANADPYLGHGIVAASEIMLERALRTETIERAEQIAAEAKKKH